MGRSLLLLPIPCTQSAFLPRSKASIRTWTIVLAAVVALVAPSSTPSQVRGKTPERVIGQFYEKVRGFSGEGVPQDREIKALLPLISDSLAGALRAARGAEQRYKANSPEPVPPMIEGSLFCSQFEGYTSIKGIRPDSSCQDCFRVEFVYQYTLKSEADTTRTENRTSSWTDRVLMARRKGQWVVDDIVLLAEPSFGLRGSVRAILKSLEAQ